MGHSVIQCRRRPASPDSARTRRDERRLFRLVVALVLSAGPVACGSGSGSSDSDGSVGSDGSDGSARADGSTGSDGTAPSVPTGLSGVALTPYQVQLTWTASTDDTGVTGYRIFRGGTAVGTSSAVTYLHGGLAPETAYEFTVAAFDAAGNESAPSSGVSVSTPAATGATQLSTLAASMAPGEWATLGTLGFDDGGVLVTDGGGSILEYNSELSWDPIGRRLLIIGTARGVPAIYGRDTNQKWVQYAEATNTWTVLPNPEHYIGFHAYDHAALDTTNGDYYVRTVGSAQVWRFRGNSWARIADIPLDYASCCNSLEYFPGMGAIVFVRGSVNGNTEIFRYNDSDDSWSPLAADVSMPMGGYHDFLEYSSVHDMMFFGGGVDPDWPTGQRPELYSMDRNGNVVRRTDAPFTYNLSGTQTVTEPTSGNVLFFRLSDDSDKTQFHEYVVGSDTWQTRATDPTISLWGARGVVATAIPEYGVVVFLRHNNANSALILYKHKPL